MTVIAEARPAVGFDPATLPADLYIGGAWRAGATGKRIDVVDPSTGARLRARWRMRSVEDGLAAVDAAHATRWPAGRRPRRASARRSCAAASS